jgi:hypothetical protein
MIISNLKRHDRNTLRAFFDLSLPTGMILRGCTYHERNGKFWIGWPAKPCVRSDGTPYTVDGKPQWSAIVDFVDAPTKWRLQDEVLPLVKEALDVVDA